MTLVLRRNTCCDLDAPTYWLHAHPRPGTERSPIPLRRSKSLQLSSLIQNRYAGLGSAQCLDTFPGHLSFLEVYVLETLPVGEFGRGLIIDPRACLQAQSF